MIPDVKNIVKVGDFVLEVYAYRPITPLEARMALGIWKKQTKRKKMPKHGTGKLITTFGFDEG